MAHDLKVLLKIVDRDCNSGRQELQIFLDAHPQHMSLLDGLTSTSQGLLRFIQFVHVLNEQHFMPAGSHAIMGLLMFDLQTKVRELLTTVMDLSNPKEIALLSEFNIDLNADVVYDAIERHEQHDAVKNFRMVSTSTTAILLLMLADEYGDYSVNHKSFKIRGEFSLQCMAGFLQFMADLKDLFVKIETLHETRFNDDH
jgi:hypothetical protein